MKYILTYLVLFLLWIQLPVHAGNVNFFLDVCRFQNVEGNPYAEIYLSIDGTSVTYQKDESGNYFASALVFLKLNKMDGEDTLTIFADKYNLLSSPLNDTSLESRKKGFMDLRRVPLSDGEYVISAEVKDNYVEGGGKVVAINEFSILAGDPDDLAMSEIEFVHEFKKSKEQNAFTKNGYEVVPFNTNGAFIDQKELKYYLEIYNSFQLEGDNYMVQTRLKRGNEYLFLYDKMVKKPGSKVDILYSNLDISMLPSQTYRLEINILSQGEVVQSVVRRFFIYNSAIEPEMNAYVAGLDLSGVFEEFSGEQLDYYIRTLIYYSTEQEISMAQRLETTDQKRGYMYGFFERRLESDTRTVAQVWRGHMAKLTYCNEQFESVLREGWETDRGRIFITYGIPSDIERFPYQETQLPYELWRYDRLGAQTKVLFVFYDPDLATNEYPILHSNKYGEMNNPGWRRQLVDGDNPGFIDQDGGTNLNDYMPIEPPRR